MSTDNLSIDYKFFLDLLESICDQKAKFNSSLVQQIDLSPYQCNAPNSLLQIVSNNEAIRLAIAAMLIDMALDCEWIVEFNGHGTRTRE